MKKNTPKTYIIKIYILTEVFYLNIEDLNKQIYGYKDLREGEYADYMIKTIEEQQIANLNFKNFNENDNQIKF